MGIVAHVQRRIPRPTAASEAPGRLLTPRPVEAGGTLARGTVPGVGAPSAVQTRARPARFDFREITRSARALRVRVDPDADQRRFVRVHHVRKRVYLEHVRATPFAVHVLVQTFVDADHCNIDSHVFFDLNGRTKTNQRAR